MAPSDTDNANVDAVNWCMTHNCVLLAIVVPSSLHKFSLEKGLQGIGVEQYFFDYAEAHQACLDKLSNALINQRPD